MFQYIPVSTSVLVFGIILAVYISGSNAQTQLHRLRREVSTKRPLKGGVCVLPPPLQNGKYRTSEKRCPKDDTSPACMMLPGSFVPPDWVLFYTCDPGYALGNTKTVTICHEGSWKPALPVCNKLCPPLRSHSLDLNCTFGGTKVSCDQQMRPGTVATQKCKEYHNPPEPEPESLELTCLTSGTWNYPLSYCTPDAICKKEGEHVWTCKKIDECNKAKEGLSQRIIPQTCYISGKEPLVCCEPEIRNRVEFEVEPKPEERKSAQMCKKYAKSVYLSVKTKNGTEKIDTCSLIEPVDAPVPEDTHDIPELSSNAEPREFPHIAVIGYGEKSYKMPAVRCVGSLISERYVLSVAYCTHPQIGQAEWVRLGDYNIDSNKDDEEFTSQTVIYDIEERINHPEYQSRSKANEIVYHDIALYRLKSTVKFNKYIRPICLYQDNTFTKTFALTTGWGPVELGEPPSEILQKVNVTIVENKACSDAYKFYGEDQVGLNTEKVLCAALVDGRETCMNLHGSPLQIRTRDPYCMYSLAGMKYMGRNCLAKSPAVYTRISYYLDWIESIVWTNQSATQHLLLAK